MNSKTFVEIFSSKKNAFLTLIILGTFILFSPPTDADFGWHYKYGEIITNTLSIPKNNTFSFTFADYSWANSYWLSQVIIYNLFTTFGAVGLSLIMSFLFVFAIYFLFVKAGFHVQDFAFSVLLLLIIISSYVLTVRPLFFSSIFLLGLVFILNFSRKRIPYLPILFLFWANMHADFVLAFGIFGIYLFSYLLENKLRFIHILSYVVSLLATLINPYGINLFVTLLKEAHPFQFKYIQEWRPLWENSADHIIYYIFFIGLMHLFYWKKLDLGAKLTFILFFILSIRFTYFSRVLILTSFYTWVGGFAYLLENFKTSISEKKFSQLVFALKFTTLVLSVFLSVSFFAKVNYASDPQLWSLNAKYPYGAVTYIKELDYSGNIYNFYGWGGYLIWNLPENKVFIDGRMPSWRKNTKSVFEDYVSIALSPEEEFDLFKNYIIENEVKYVLLTWDSDLVQTLLKKNWSLEYSDSVSVLLKTPAILD